VTSAPESLEADQRHRIRRYFLTMGIRTVCFLLAAWTSATGRPWWVWGSCAVLAVVLPYVAVVMANAVRARPAVPMQSAAPPADDKRFLEQ
jgi:hypothetical protein